MYGTILLTLPPPHVGTPYRDILARAMDPEAMKFHEDEEQRRVATAVARRKERDTTLLQGVAQCKVCASRVLLPPSPLTSLYYFSSSPTCLSSMTLVPPSLPPLSIPSLSSLSQSSPLSCLSFSLLTTTSLPLLPLHPPLHPHPPHKVDALTAMKDPSYWEQVPVSMIDADSEAVLKLHVPRSTVQPILDMSLTGSSAVLMVTLSVERKGRVPPHYVPCRSS